MKYIDADQIRAEIERRREANKRQYHSSAGGMSWQRMCGEEDCLVELLVFLDTLQEQPDGLEEAAENYIAPIENDEGLDYINFNGRDIKDAFIAGAEWRYQKDRGEFAKLKAKEWSDGYNEGIVRGKEKMLEDAIEIEVKEDAGGYPIVPFDAIELYDYENDKPLAKAGDKVRVIVIKESEK